MNQPPDGRGPGSRDPLVGTVLDSRYELLRRLGRGGMSTVYGARHLLLQKEVAVKVLREELAHDQRVIEMIFREARTVARLGHPAIVNALDVGITPEGLAYMVLELLDGVSLGYEIARCRRIDPARAVRIAIQVASAMEAAHGAGVVHRDLKPENIYLLRSGGQPGAGDTCKVLDFGVAKHTVRALHGSTPTFHGGVVGTPGYMAPEQLLTPDRVDHRADIYSLGVVLYEMLVGRPPYHDILALPDLVLRVQQGRSPRIADAQPAVAPDLAEIVDMAMAHSATDRFQAMDEFGRALRSHAVATGAFSDVPWLLVGGATPPPVYVPSLRQPQPQAMASGGALRDEIEAASPHGDTPTTLPSAADLAAMPPSPPAASDGVAPRPGGTTPATHAARSPAATPDVPSTAAAPTARRRWVAALLLSVLAVGGLAAWAALLDRDFEQAAKLDLISVAVKGAEAQGKGADAQGKGAEAQGKGAEAQGKAPAPGIHATEPGPSAVAAVTPGPAVTRPVLPLPAKARSSRQKAAATRTESAPVATATRGNGTEPVAVAAVAIAPAPPAPPVAPPTVPVAPAGPAPLAAAVIEKQVGAHRAAVDACIAEDPSVSGRLMLRVIVRADGIVESVQAESGASPAVRACIVKQAKTWRFPPGTSRAEGRCAIELD